MRSWLLVLAACGSSQREPIAWREPVEIAHGGGLRGPWQQNNSQYDYVDDPSVALTPGGDAVVAWVDHRHKDAFWQVYAPDGAARLAGPVNLSRSGSVFSWLPRLALAPQDPQHVYVVWQEIVFSGGTHGGDIFFARSRDGGRTCEPAQNLSTSIAGDGKGRIDAKRWHNGSFDLAVGPDGAIYVAWTSYEGELRIRRSRDGGEMFDDAVVVVAPSPEPARAPALAIGRDALYIAWTVGENAAADIRVAMSRDGRTFAAPVIVERTPGYSDAPKLAVDASGTMHVAYADSAGGPFERAEVRYTRSRGGASFEPARRLSSPDAGAGFPSLAIDASRVFISWEHTPRSEDRPRGLGLAYSLDAGTTFSAPSLIAGTTDRGTNGSFEGRLMRKLAVRGDTIVVVNSAVRSGESSRVWLVRGALE
jgi:hypothetical protein